MTTTLIEAGPVTVRGPHPVPWDHAATAVECVDDAMALIDDEPVAVDELWSEVLRNAAGTGCEDVVLVCPTWWTEEQVERVAAAAATAFLDAGAVTVLPRADALAPEHVPWAVVEIAEDVVLVSRSDHGPVAVLRGDGDIERAVAAVLETVVPGGAVTVDAPRNVRGVGDFGQAVAEQLRRNGINVSIGDTVVPRSRRPAAVSHWRPAAVPHWRPAAVPHWRPAAVSHWRPAAVPRPRRRFRFPAAVCAGLSVAALFAVFAATSHRPRMDAPTATLTEGRVSMQVPAAWHAQRRTGGTGSARVQVTSPADPEVALQLTQSGLPPGQAVADSLRRALDEQPEGVFVEFNPRGRVAGREAVTYRELRAAHHVLWVVLADNGIRIAIGCQSSPQHPDAIRNACDDAVRTAHAEF